MDSGIDKDYLLKVYGISKTDYLKKDNQMEESAFINTVLETNENSRKTIESVVEQYKKMHPDQASVVDSQVLAGKALKKKKGVSDVDTEKMSMGAYKSFIFALLDSIPFHPSRRYDKELISISEAGWEQMKKDPDYEAWVLGYTVQNRSVPNPFFGLAGASGSYYMEYFGATIDEHIGKSLGSIELRPSTSPNKKKEKSWWEKRQERMKELLEEYVEKQRRKEQAQRKLAQEQYHNSVYASQQRLRGFLLQDVLGEQEVKRLINFQASDMATLAAEAYESNINLFTKKSASSSK
ncbi:MAG: hypothetical protein J1E62_01955 [Lachnospiraceae bacterium]|nr:hypothetical protein [Lachnospiraceae bacterium]